MTSDYEEWSPLIDETIGGTNGGIIDQTNDATVHLTKTSAKLMRTDQIPPIFDHLKIVTNCRKLQ